MSRKWILSIALVASLFVSDIKLPVAQAGVGDISVGGIWVCRITRGAAGLTLEQRVRQVNQRITDVLSLSTLPQRRIPVEVRPAGTSAAIVVAGITVITVTAEDVAESRMSPDEVARQWAARLVRGLSRALPGREVIARMYAPEVPTPPEDGHDDVPE